MFGESLFPNLFAERNIQVGDCFVLGMLYGKISAKNGGLYEFCTPHGTVIKIGWIWLIKDGRRCNYEDLLCLREFEDRATKSGIFYQEYLDYSI